MCCCLFVVVFQLKFKMMEDIPSLNKLGVHCPVFISSILTALLYSIYLHTFPFHSLPFPCLPPITQPNYTLMADICNLWRNYNDIEDSWASVVDIISHYADNQDDFQPFAGPGHWNDPDMVSSWSSGWEPLSMK